jgi:hypothetical protein
MIRVMAAIFVYAAVFSGKPRRQYYLDDKLLLFRSGLLPHEKGQWRHFCLYSCFQESKDDNTIWLTNSCFSGQNSRHIIRNNGAIFLYTAVFQESRYDNTIWMTNSCFSGQTFCHTIRGNGDIFVYTAVFSGKQRRQYYLDDKLLLFRSGLLPHDKGQ